MNRTHDTPLALVGNALAVQVAALERARCGLRTLAINPGGPWGGYFAGIQIGARRWDAGMVLYDCIPWSASDAPPPLAGYDPMRRSDVTRFCATVTKWVDRHQRTRDVDPLQMWTSGRALPDLLLGDGLAALPQLPCAEAARAQLRDIVCTPGPWHASHKLGWPADVGYDMVSRLNHGSVLHEAVFAPFARKVLGTDSHALPALYHRLPWLPLYWPEMLSMRLEGWPQQLPPTVFRRPIGASVADLCADLSKQMDASPLVDVRHDRVLHVERDGAGFALALQRGGRVHAARLGWAQTPRQGLAACGAGAAASTAAEVRLPLTLVFLQFGAHARARRFSVLHTIDSDTGCYRIFDASDADEGTPLRLVLESHSDVLARHHGPLPDDAAVLRAARADLARVGAVAPAAAPTVAHVLRLPGARPLPTADGLAGFEADRAELLRRLPGAELLAASAGPFATALADHVVQGLQIAARGDETHATITAAPRPCRAPA